MARVCIDWFPKGWDKRQRKAGFYLDNSLKSQLDILIKNIADDWDFTIIITGGGEVRVGKSVLAMQIGAYWAHEVQRIYKKKTIFDVEHNFVLDGRTLIKKGNELGQAYPYSVLIYDEAGADLEGRKQVQQQTQDVIDFYRECGQYNLLNILVMPDFFDLPKGIALHRSIFLLDVYYTANSEGKFERGYFKFYSRRNKKYLYLKGKRELDYRAHPHNLQGRFLPFYPIDEQAYRALKQGALTNRGSKRKNQWQTQRDACWYLLTHEFGMKQADLAHRMENLTGVFVPQATLSDGIAHFKSENS
jgi:hypothetical protein